MEEYTPLFIEESQRTKQFRRVIVRKTIQLMRQYPKASDEEIQTMAENEAVQICDLCVESSFEEGSRPLIEQYFLTEKEGQRRNHVGRFFLHKLEDQLKGPLFKECLFPLLADSVKSLLGEEKYDIYTGRIKAFLQEMGQQGMSYNESMDSQPAYEIMEEIIGEYLKEMKSFPKFQEQLKSQIDDALGTYQSKNPEKVVNIDKNVQLIFDKFMHSLEINS
ncbi:hypothetical protein ACTRW9_00875 [Nitrospina sp. 32_T5]|uniref:hypothetical protein n=1 Tax=unclassified Nitrospina TaxID=2638683 RepID=UPI003F9B06DA